MSDISDIINIYTEQILLSAKEEENEFIFHTLRPFLEETCEMKINKRVLIRALSCFREEHKEEFEMLMKGENQ